MYDLIGDIHGHATPLKTLLQLMDYYPENGVWQHPDRKVIFVGDYIDRGPQIRETLQIVKAMVDNGKAIALMGNHEYNALAYAYPLPGGRFLRAHNATHNRQHQATIDQFRDHPGEWQMYLDWFYTLPLFADLGSIRAVHACWDQEHIDWLSAHNHYTMIESLLLDSFRPGNKAVEVIEQTLKGKEFNIPEKYAWHDKDGHLRTSNRLKWWINPEALTYGDFLFNCPPELRDQPVNKSLQVSVYPGDAPPVFFGHYWMEDKFPVIQAGNVICLDYSVAKGGNLVAYRWNGEQGIDNRHFIFIR
jgi:hypothetical protein